MDTIHIETEIDKKDLPELGTFRLRYDDKKEMFVAEVLEKIINDCECHWTRFIMYRDHKRIIHKMKAELEYYRNILIEAGIVHILGKKK